VTLRGEQDYSSRPQISQALDAACLHPNVVVDLSDCTFVDSSVVTELLRTARRLHQLDGVLALAVPSGARAVRRALEVMGVHPILPVHETRAAAIGSIECAQGPPARGNGLSLRATSEVVEESSTRSDR
jgi:anti-anti-sigma factor